MFIEGEIPNVVTTTGGNNGNGGFMNGDGWWAIILFALIFGYGRNGFGGGFGGFGGGSGVGENYILATDFATIERKLDTISNGICDSTFALNNTINTGFFGVQNALCQGFNGINQSISTEFRGLDNRICDLGYALKDCCCQTQRAIDGVNFNLVNQFGSLNNTLCGLGRDIIENQNANYRQIHEELVANKLEAKNDRIAELQDKLYRADLRASQAQQSNYITDTILNKLSPCPNPAYIVPNPNCCYDYNVTRNNGCGCY
jgi:hypothetical protein